jgi:hypothetical protein
MNLEEPPIRDDPFHFDDRAQTRPQRCPRCPRQRGTPPDAAVVTCARHRLDDRQRKQKQRDSDKERGVVRKPTGPRLGADGTLLCAQHACPSPAAKLTTRRGTAATLCFGHHARTTFRQYRKYKLPLHQPMTPLERYGEMWIDGNARDDALATRALQWAVDHQPRRHRADAPVCIFCPERRPLQRNAAGTDWELRCVEYQRRSPPSVPSAHRRATYGIDDVRVWLTDVAVTTGDGPISVDHALYVAAVEHRDALRRVIPDLDETVRLLSVPTRLVAGGGPVCFQLARCVDAATLKYLACRAKCTWHGNSVNVSCVVAGCPVTAHMTCTTVCGLESITVGRRAAFICTRHPWTVKTATVLLAACSNNAYSLLTWRTSPASEELRDAVVQRDKLVDECARLEAGDTTVVVASGGGGDDTWGFRFLPTSE